MLGRLAAVAALIAMASCAGLEPAGRNASRSPAPARAASAPAPQQTAPATVAPAPQQAPPVTLPQPAPAPSIATAAPPEPQAQAAPPPSSVAAPQVTVPTPQPAPRQQAAGDDIIVPGQVERQVAPPTGDPRSVSERMRDVRAWDQCVMQVQSAFESDPTSPQLTTPEEYCRGSLGMTNRDAVPASRRSR